MIYSGDGRSLETKWHLPSNQTQEGVMMTSYPCHCPADLEPWWMMGVTKMGQVGLARYLWVSPQWLNTHCFLSMPQGILSDHMLYGKSAFGEQG